MKILLAPSPTDATGNHPAATNPDPPESAVVVLSGKKSERELLLEAENQKLKAAVAKTAATKRKVEIDNAHLADENKRLKQIPEQPQPTAKEKFTWMGFGNQ